MSSGAKHDKAFLRPHAGVYPDWICKEWARQDFNEVAPVVLDALIVHFLRCQHCRIRLKATVVAVGGSGPN